MGKAPGAVEMDQDGINGVLVDRGAAGKLVVRLKGGDPFVFGRGGEEAEALAAAGVPFEVVPGITSAIAAPAYAGIPVTHRGLSTHFTVVTGHEDPAKGTTDTDWDALARAGGTLVILMGAGRIGDLAERLVASGRAPETPVAAVRWGTRPEQQTIRATLATIGDAGVRPPSAIVVGPVAGLDLTWFESRPLFGRTIVITRAREQASALRARLVGLGAAVMELPSIALEPVDIALPDLTRYGWLVLTSANGVAALFDRALAAAGLDRGPSPACRSPRSGRAPPTRSRRRGIRADLVPPRFVAESLLDAFPDPVTPGEPVLLARAEQARDVLPEGLAAKGFEVDVLPVYRTVRAEPAADELERVRSGAVDAITFTSSSTVANFCDLVGRLPDPQPLVVSIGPITSTTARERDLRVDAEADPHDIDGLVDVLLTALAPTAGGT